MPFTSTVTSITQEDDFFLVAGQVHAYLQGLASPPNSPNPNGIPYLTQVFLYPEKVTPEGDFYQSPGIGFGGLIYLWFGDTTDDVIGLAGPTVSERWFESVLTMRLIFRSQEEDSQKVGCENEKVFVGHGLRVAPGGRKGKTGRAWQTAGPLLQSGLVYVPGGNSTPCSTSPSPSLPCRNPVHSCC